MLSILHQLLVRGALEKGWGGPVCRAAVPLQTHFLESSFWLIICAICYWKLDFSKKLNELNSKISLELKTIKVRPIVRNFETFLGLIHFLMYFQLIYYKANMSALVNLIQPCHLILLLEGIALYSNSSRGVLITMFLLPSLTGTSLAMLFPETGGLDQPFEELAYWWQHYIIQIVPLYLLLRRNSLALKNSSFFSVVVGLWILLFLHFSLFEVVDLLTNVNVEFMLCPTGAMVVIFANFPPWFTFPSYRSTLTIGVFIIGTLISYFYLGLAKVIETLFLSHRKQKTF